MKRQPVTCETVFFYLGIAGVIACFAAAVVMEKLEFSLTGSMSPCLVQAFLGIPCPGCGGTRALEYLLQGKIWQSILAHPMVVYGVVAYLYFMGAYAFRTFVRKKVFCLYSMPLRKTLIVGAVAVLLIQWIGKVMVFKLW